MPPKKPGKVISITPFLKKRKEMVEKPKPATITDIGSSRNREYLWRFHFSIKERGVINSAISLCEFLEELPNHEKRILRMQLVSAIEAILLHEANYPVKTYFKQLREHLSEIKQM